MAFYVYELVDPRDQSVFYVGKGKGSRIDAHELEARKGRQSRKCERIREIEASGLAVVKRKVRQFADEQEAYDFEEDQISLYGLRNLTNVLPGWGVASKRPTLANDRLRVRVAAELTRRLGNGRIESITLFGSKLELLPILASFKRGAAEVIGRRGLDWANKIAARFNVQFAYDG